ncbi:MAG: AAA family ATPase [Clostridia bacterium]|nr:AAA family ATPase [Clostridia bacterium]
MDEKEFLREKEKLKEVSRKLEKEEHVIEDNLQNTSKSYDKESYVRAHLVYLGHKKLQDLKKIKDKPYFARIDFTAKDEKLEKLYIGKLSILDSENQQPIIIDWRAPISNLYYDGRVGKSSYESPGGKVEGEISLKRQYFIEKKELLKYSDIDLKANDELLQVALEEKADDRLKNIVATIQGEQNNIIRADMNKALIVQGVAGSGKTTIALHRIAYLIYNCDKEFNPEDFMIIAPNKFFLNYISNVLPDLGVENVKQYTFEDLAYEIIGKKLKISDSNEKLVTIVNKEFDEINNGDINTIIQESKLKSSIEFKTIVDGFLKELEENYLPKKDFLLENVRIMRYENIQKLFTETYKDLDFEKRINEVKKHIFSKIKNNKQIIEDTITAKRSARIKAMLKDETLTEEEQREKRIEIFEETESVLKKLEKNDIKIVDSYFNEITRKDAIEHYKDFIENYIFDKVDNEILGSYLVRNTMRNLNKGEVTFEDLAPIIYIHYKIYGTKVKSKLRHVIVDEAQDYGEFQFSVLKTILKSNSMTILGDIAQGVHSYRGIENWKKFIDVEFPEGDAIYTTLEKTYRTTKDIMYKANEVIEKLPEFEKQFIVKGEPVIDRNDSIHIKEMQNEDEIIKACSEKINEYISKGFKSIAIIGKDMKECKNIKKKIEKFNKDIKLIQSKDSEYHAGISIVPSYLAKGLEFDSVILFNVNNENYQNTVLDIKLLYVAITRAMSKLDVFYTGKIAEIMN